MIDERINKALKNIEDNLSNLESAHEQVEKTVNSYNGLKSTTAEYVDQLGTITAKVKELVDAIGKDYSQKVITFEKDRETIINASTNATDKLSHTTDEFKDSLAEIQTKLKYSLIVNAVSLVAIGIIVFLLLK